MNLPHNYVTLSREEHGLHREGRITSSVAHLLMRGSKASWIRLAQHLDNPPPFEQLNVHALQYGHEQEPKAAKSFLDRHPEMGMWAPTLVYHHNKSHPLRHLVAASPDRVIRKGRGKLQPLEIKSVLGMARARHLKGLINRYPKVPPKDFSAQLSWEAWVMGAKAVWLVVYHPKAYTERKYILGEQPEIDELLAQFAEQYGNFTITGARI